MAGSSRGRTGDASGGDDGAKDGATARAAVDKNDDKESLRKFPWFWPYTTRDEVNSRLAGQPDGTFLVRDCSVPGDFTLTVRKAGANRCVRIYNHPSGYSLSSAEPDQPFPSLQALVEAYRHRSVSFFNKRLDICLGHPLAKPSRAKCDQHGVFKELYDLSQDQLSTQTRLTALLQQRSDLNRKVELLKMMLPALRVVQQMYFEGMQQQDQWMPKPPELASLSLGTAQEDSQPACDGEEEFPDRLRADLCGAGIGQGEEKDYQKLSKAEEKSFAANAYLLMSRHSDMSDRLHGVKSHYDMDIIKLQELDSELQHVELVLLHMKRRHEELVRQLVEMGCQKEYLSGVLESRVGSVEFDRSTWLRDCSRDEALALLEGLPHGAFLVRRKNKRHLPYVLSIVISGESGTRTVQHCYIVRPHGRGFGFNPALAVFESMDQLVLRHRHVSLRHYFKQLDVMLTFPVGCQDLLTRSLSESEKESVRVGDGEYANAAAIESTMADNVYEPVDFPEGGGISVDVGGPEQGNKQGSGGLSSGSRQSSHTSAVQESVKRNPYVYVNSSPRHASSRTAAVPALRKEHEYEAVGESHKSTETSSSAGKQFTVKGHRYQPMGFPAVRTEAAQTPDYYEFVKDHKYETIPSRSPVEPATAASVKKDSQQHEHIYEDVSAKPAKPARRQTTV